MGQLKMIKVDNEFVTEATSLLCESHSVRAQKRDWGGRRGYSVTSGPRSGEHEPSSVSWVGQGQDLRRDMGGFSISPRS
jgi:hypothetical protein